MLASNTSSIPIMKLAAATERPERVIGMHFFNPVPVLPLVELVRSLLTSTETLHRAETFATERRPRCLLKAPGRFASVLLEACTSVAWP